MSKRLFSLLFISILASTLSLLANESTNENYQEMRELKMQQAELKVKQRLVHLKQKLNIQKNQLNAWKAYQANILKNSSLKIKATQALRKKYIGSNKKPNSLELSNINIQRLELKLVAAKTQHQALEKFYIHLNDKQKAKIDKLMHRKIKKEAKRLRHNKQQREK